MTELTHLHDDELELHPLWRQAVANFLEQDFKPGDIVSFQWLHDNFKIAMLSPETPWSEAEKNRLSFLGQFKPFENHMLSEYNVALSSVRGLGYRIVPVAEQTGWAEKEGRNDLRRGMKKMRRRLTFVDHAQLTAPQRRENADALARWSMLRSMSRKILDTSSKDDTDPEV